MGKHNKPDRSTGKWPPACMSDCYNLAAAVHFFTHDARVFDDLPKVVEDIRRRAESVLSVRGQLSTGGDPRVKGLWKIVGKAEAIAKFVVARDLIKMIVGRDELDKLWQAYGEEVKKRG